MEPLRAKINQKTYKRYINPTKLVGFMFEQGIRRRRHTTPKNEKNDLGIIIWKLQAVLTEMDLN